MNQFPKGPRVLNSGLTKIHRDTFVHLGSGIVSLKLLLLWVLKHLHIIIHVISLPLAIKLYKCTYKRATIHVLNIY